MLVSFEMPSSKKEADTGVRCALYTIVLLEGCAPEAEGAAGVGVVAPFAVVEEADLLQNHKQTAIGIL